ncbi:hypothetical protein V6N13_099825 [Hibiscus sabdariffa]|uniref:O-fucosyltransferase family protein n=2 Tax=Hibiscus sabdariffa TaxID=183260 RepID=A0ABR2NLW6_9ROSI
MEDSKHGFEEEEAFVEYDKVELKCSVNGIRAEKSKNSVTGAIKLDKLKSLMLFKSPGFDQFRPWMLVLTTMMVLLWLVALQLASMRKNIGSTTVKFDPPPYFPPPRAYNNEGYLMVTCNGGLNQMRAGICDMVAIARFLNLTLVVPELDETSFWHDNRSVISSLLYRSNYDFRLRTVLNSNSFSGSQFKDIWDVDYFIKSLADEVRIIKHLPPRLRKQVQRDGLYSMPPVSWSNMSYYYNTVFPRFRKYEVVQFTKTDARLGNNLPVEVQKMRCRVNYEALRFTPAIEEMGKKIIRILREKGPFLVLHLRYEMDMLAFSGCTAGCNQTEVEELTRMRYAIPWWKEKEIDPKSRREAGLCPLTPLETAITLRAFSIDPKMQIYIAAGDIYGGNKRLAALKASYPNLVKKETLLSPSDLKPFQNYSNQMAALDYLVSLDCDIFLPTYGGNMAKVVEGHRRYLGYRMTISLDRLVLISLIDQYKNGTLKWTEFSQAVKAAHANRMGSPSQRLQFPGEPKLEDYFYTNPQECLPSIVAGKPVKEMG